MKYRYRINKHPFSHNKMYEVHPEEHRFVKTAEYNEWLAMMAKELKKRKVTLEPKTETLIAVEFGIGPGFDTNNMLKPFCDAIQNTTQCNDIWYTDFLISTKRVKKGKGHMRFTLKQ